MSDVNDTTVTYRGFDGEPGHEELTSYLDDLLGQTLSHFLPTEPYHLDLKICHENLHNNRNNQLFRCEALVNIEGQRNPIVVTKTDENFYLAAQACESVLRKILTRRTRTRQQARHCLNVLPLPA